MQETDQQDVATTSSSLSANITEAEKNLQQAEEEYGPDHVKCGYRLEQLAKLLRQLQKDSPRAAHLERRARDILLKQYANEMKGPGVKKESSASSKTVSTSFINDPKSPEVKNDSTLPGKGAPADSAQKPKVAAPREDSNLPGKSSTSADSAQKPKVAAPKEDSNLPGKSTTTAHSAQKPKVTAPKEDSNLPGKSTTSADSAQKPKVAAPKEDSNLPGKSTSPYHVQKPKSDELKRDSIASAQANLNKVAPETASTVTTANVSAMSNPSPELATALEALTAITETVVSTGVEPAAPTPIPTSLEPAASESAPTSVEPGASSGIQTSIEPPPQATEIKTDLMATSDIISNTSDQVGDATQVPAESSATGNATQAPAESSATGDATQVPSESSATGDATQAPAESSATGDAIQVPSESSAAGDAIPTSEDLLKIIAQAQSDLILPSANTASDIAATQNAAPTPLKSPANSGTFAASAVPFRRTSEANADSAASSAAAQTAADTSGKLAEATADSSARINSASTSFIAGIEIDTSKMQASSAPGYLSKDIVEAEANLQKAAAQYGAGHIQYSYCLDDLAKLLRTANIEALLATEMEKKAKEIRIQHYAEEMKGSEINKDLLVTSRNVSKKFAEEQRKKDRKQLVAIVVITAALMGGAVLYVTPEDDYSGPIGEKVKVIIKSLKAMNPAIMMNESQRKAKEAAAKQKKHDDEINKFINEDAP